jgi:hypothetical protein
MKFLSSQRFLVVYSGLLTAVFAITLLSGFRDSPGKLRLKELDVQRINVIEPDGTLRMVISDKHDFPGLIVKNKEVYAHKDRRTAGMLFFNDEGTENGGLIFGGYKDKDGKPVNYGHLSFDQYMQDQTVVLESSQHGGEYSKYLGINDMPDYPITDLLPLVERLHAHPTPRNQAALKAFFAEHGKPTPRLFLGQNPKKDLVLDMKDDSGRNRIVLKVQPDGSPSLQFLDARGNVIGRLPAAAKKP